MFLVFGVEYCNVNGVDGVLVFLVFFSGGMIVLFWENFFVGYVVYILIVLDMEYYVLNLMFLEFGINGN